MRPGPLSAYQEIGSLRCPADELSNDPADIPFRGFPVFHGMQVSEYFLPSRRCEGFERNLGPGIPRKRAVQEGVHRNLPWFRIERNSYGGAVADIHTRAHAHRRVKIEPPGSLVADKRLPEWFVIERSAYRNWNGPVNSNWLRGFRCVRSLARQP